MKLNISGKGWNVALCLTLQIADLADKPTKLEHVRPSMLPFSGAIIAAMDEILIHNHKTQPGDYCIIKHQWLKPGVYRSGIGWIAPLAEELVDVVLNEREPV